MLVKIEEIKEQGLDLTQAIERAVLDEALASSDDFALVSATPLSVSFKKISGQVHLTGSFQATVTCPCKRCLATVTEVVPVSFSLRMVVAAPPPAAKADEAEAKPRRGRKKPPPSFDDLAEAELGPELDLSEVDAEPFDGKKIDLDPIVREQVLLALPVSVVCGEDCKGLCPKCGQNLNEADCGHAGQRELDPRLAKLKDITLKH